MSVASISELINSYKRTSSLQKWIEDAKTHARADAYNNRDIINKKELEEELHKLDYVLPLWKIFKNLRKMSPEYECFIMCDLQGYIDFQIIFPITPEELHKANELKQAKIAQVGRFYTSCIRLPELVWEACHERINKVFKGVKIRDYKSYQPYGSNPLIRWADISSVEC